MQGKYLVVAGEIVVESKFIKFKNQNLAKVKFNWQKNNDKSLKYSQFADLFQSKCMLTLEKGGKFVSSEEQQAIALTDVVLKRIEEPLKTLKEVSEE